VNDRTKRSWSFLEKSFLRWVFICLPPGTAPALESAGIEAEGGIQSERRPPNIVDLVKTGKIDLVINTPWARIVLRGGKSIRRAAIRYKYRVSRRLPAAHAALAEFAPCSNRERKSPRCQD